MRLDHSRFPWPIAVIAVACSAPVDDASSDVADTTGRCEVPYPVDLTVAPARAQEFEAEAAKLIAEFPATTSVSIDDVFGGGIDELKSPIPVHLDDEGPMCEQIARGFTDVVAAREALFRLDLTGYAIVNCQKTSTGIHVVTLARSRMGAFSAFGEIVQVSASPEDKTLHRVSAEYIPESLELALPAPACARRGTAADVVGLELPWSITFPQPGEVDAGVYEVKPDDSIQPFAEAVATLVLDDDDVGRVRLLRQVDVVVNPANHAPAELLHSDASRCGVGKDPPEIRFSVRVDAVTGEAHHTEAGVCP